MTLEDKVDSAKDQAVGKVKDVGGDVTGNEKMEAEGKVQEMTGKAKEKLADAKDEIKEKTKNATDKAAEKFNDVVDDVKKKYE